MSLTPYRSSLYRNISEQIDLLVDDEQALNSIRGLSALSNLVASALELLLEERQIGDANELVNSLHDAQIRIVKRYRQLNTQAQGASDGTTS